MRKLIQLMTILMTMNIGLSMAAVKQVTIDHRNLSSIEVLSNCQITMFNSVYFPRCAPEVQVNLDAEDLHLSLKDFPTYMINRRRVVTGPVGFPIAEEVYMSGEYPIHDEPTAQAMLSVLEAHVNSQLTSSSLIHSLVRISEGLKEEEFERSGRDGSRVRRVCYNPLIIVRYEETTGQVLGHWHDRTSTRCSR